MNNYKYINMKEMPSIKEEAAEWFHSKWGVPKEGIFLDIELREGF